MSHATIVLLTFAATVLLAIAVAQLVYDWLLRYRLELHQRLKQLNSDHDEDDITLFRNFAAGKRRASSMRRSLDERLSNLFHQAGFEGTAGKLLAWSAGCGFALAVPALWRGAWSSVIAFAIGCLLPAIVLHTRRHFRSRALARQLPEAFEMMSRAVRAGQTVPAAIQIIAEDFEPPISEEFKLCYEQQDLGMSREAALQQLAERTSIMELQIFVVALLVQARFGGDLAELLDNLSIMIRKRFKLSQRVRALTGEGRMQATVLTILPIAALGGLIVLAPDYIHTLWSRPWLLAGNEAAQVIGLLWIRRIVSFEV